MEFDSAIESMWDAGTGLAAAGRLGRRHSHMDLDWRHRCHWCPGWGRLCHAVSRGLQPSWTQRIALHSDQWWCLFPHLRIVFKALVYAENQFACQFAPLRSHEERLTGHLLSECFAALRVVSETVRAAATACLGAPMDFELDYADLSAGRAVEPDGRSRSKESVTGADFALIVTHHIPGELRGITVGTAFQAKKMRSDSAEIDVAQLAALGKFAGWNGSRYCFYDTDSARRLAPFVVEPDDMWELSGNPHAGENVDEFDPSEAGRDHETMTVAPLMLGRATLAEYLVFGMILSEQGSRFGSVCEAYQGLVHGGDGGAPPARVLALSVRSRERQDDGPSIRDLLGTPEVEE
jgi:hypothetical protein